MSSRVTPAARPLKKHRKQYVAKLAAGISRYGFLVPMLVDECYRLVAGHARLAAAQLLKLQEVPVIRVDHLTDEQRRMLAIYENKIASESEFDEEALNLEFEELRLTEPEIELTDSGFAIGEIDALAGRIKTKALDDLDYAEDEPPEKPSVSRLGDIWLCGRHRQICGDSTDSEVIARLVAGAKICQLIADCPYNLPTRAFSSSGRFSNFEMGAGEMNPAEFVDFLIRFFAAATPHLVDGALLYTFMDAKHIGELLAAGESAGLSYKQLLVREAQEGSCRTGRARRSCPLVSCGQCQCQDAAPAGRNQHRSPLAPDDRRQHGLHPRRSRVRRSLNRRSFQARVCPPRWLHPFQHGGKLLFHF